MFPRQLYATLFAFLLQSGTSLAGSSPAQSFLTDPLLRKGQVQNVLEHTPAKDPDCKQVVRLLSLYLIMAPPD